MGVLLAACGVSGGSAGCATMQALLPKPRVTDCDGFNVPLSALPGSSRKELRVRVKARRVDSDFPFVVESGPDSFVLIGFTPLGTKAFTLVRHGEDVHVENPLGPAQLVPPRNVMADVLAMSVPSTCSPSQDGPTPTTIGDWRISDNCKDGRPLDRKIARTRARPDEKPDVTVVYSDAGILVEQEECRYHARYILEATPLATAAAAQVATPASPGAAPSKPLAPQPVLAPAPVPAGQATSTAPAPPATSPAAAPTVTAPAAPAAVPPASADTAVSAMGRLRAWATRRKTVKNAVPAAPATAPAAPANLQ